MVEDLMYNHWELFVGICLWLVFTLTIVIYFSINTLPGVLMAMDDTVSDAHVKTNVPLRWSATELDYMYWRAISWDSRVAKNFEEYVENVAGTEIDEEQWDKYCRAS